jgi:hypothetical protein
MVAGWPHECKASFNPLLHYLNAYLLGAAGTDEMGFREHAPFIRKTEMYPLNVLHRCHVRLVFNDTFDVKKTFFEHLILGIEQPLFSFRMGCADGPIKCRKKD